MSTQQPWSLPRQIPQLDGIRGVACLAVLIHHYFTRFYSGSGSVWGHAVDPFLLSGVDLFFVLSGFLIGGILIDNRGASSYFSTFYIRRICRIFPVYYLLLGIFAAVLVLGIAQRHPAQLSWLFANPMPLASYASFTQNVFMSSFNDTGARWLGITWSLAIEEQFYLLFPLIVAVTPRKHLPVVAIAAMIAAPLCRTMAQHHISFFAAYSLLPCRMDTLMAGVLAALAVRDQRIVAFVRAHGRGIAAAQALLAAILLQGFVGGFRLGTAQYSIFACLYALCLTGAVVHSDGAPARMLRSRYLVFTGLLSYAIYMYHQAINGLVHGLFFGGQPSLSGLDRFVVTLFSLLLTYIAAYVSQVALERPIRKLGSRFRYGAAAIRQPGVLDPAVVD